jgi:hypothetical protein
LLHWYLRWIVAVLYLISFFVALFALSTAASFPFVVLALTASCVILLRLIRRNERLHLQKQGRAR